MAEYDDHCINWLGRVVKGDGCVLMLQIGLGEGKSESNSQGKTQTTNEGSNPSRHCVDSS